MDRISEYFILYELVRKYIRHLLTNLHMGFGLPASYRTECQLFLSHNQTLTLHHTYENINCLPSPSLYTKPVQL